MFYSVSEVPMINLPSVRLHMMFISSSDRVNNPSFFRRFCIIHALASSIKKKIMSRQRIQRKPENDMKKCAYHSLPDEGRGM